LGAARQCDPNFALTGEGIPALIATLAARIAPTYDIAAPLLTRARHRAALESAAGALARALGADLPELRAEDLRSPGAASARSPAGPMSRICST